jgi:hypothetical protein
LAASFEQVRLLVERYYCDLLVRGTSTRAEHLLQEVRARLRQLQWIHSRLLQLEAQLIANAQRTQLEEGSNARIILMFSEAVRPDCGTMHHSHILSETQDELWVLLESFYYSAHRVRDILRDNGKLLPGLNSFEAIGIRNVRNHLVEHPTRKSGVIVFSFKCGGPVGPQLRPMRWSLDPLGTIDNGLHKNTEEFLSSLEQVLTAYLT